MSYSKFEDIIKEKLDGFEFEYDHNEWLKLEKKLPRKPFWSTGKIFLSSFLAVIIVTSVFVLINPTKKSIPAESKGNSSLVQNNTVNPSDENKKDEPSDISFLKPEMNGNNNSSSQSPFTFNTGDSLPNNSVANAYKEKYPFAVNPKNPESENLPPQNSNNDKKLTIDASFTSNGSGGCAPMTSKFVPDFINKGHKYHWDFGDGSSSEEIMPKHTYNEKGLYIVTLTISDNSGNSGEFSGNAIVVKSRPVADFDISNENQNYIFRNNSANASQWIWKIDNIVETTKDATKTFSKSGDYEIELYALNEEGCRDSISKKVTVNIEKLFFMPTAFTPDGDGKNDVFGPEGEGISSLEYHFAIYDKSGSIVFQSNDPSHKWDGINQRTNKMASSTSDVFIWKVITRDASGNQQVQTGHVTLIIN